jgi:hypothetical protein
MLECNKVYSLYTCCLESKSYFELGAAKHYILTWAR